MFARISWLRVVLVAFAVSVGNVASWAAEPAPADGSQPAQSQIVLVAQPPNGQLPGEEIPADELDEEEAPQDLSNGMQLPEPVIRGSAALPGTWQAPSNDGTLSDVVRGAWVSLTADGLLQGAIATTTTGQGEMIPAEGLTLHFVSSGRIAGTAVTAADGTFEVPGLAPGVYSMIAIGQPGFIAYSVMVLPHAQAQAMKRGQRGVARQVAFQPAVETQIRIEALAVGPTFSTLRNLITQFYPEMELSEVDEADVVRAIESELGQGAADEGTPPWYRGLRDLLEEVPPSTPATAVRRHPVQLTEDGRMVGRLIGIQRVTGRPKMVRRANIFIIRDDRVVARSAVNELGIFEIRGLDPGLYSIVAAGPDGFGAMGFELIAAPELQASNDDSDTQFVAAAVLAGETSNLVMPLIDNPQDLAAGIGAGAGDGGGAGGQGGGVGGVVGGGTGGGGGGGGGGGAGGGAFGGGAAIAGLAAAAAAAGNDGGGVTIVTSPQQPDGVVIP